MKEEIINFLNNFPDQRNHRVIFFWNQKRIPDQREMTRY